MSESRQPRPRRTSLWVANDGLVKVGLPSREASCDWRVARILGASVTAGSVFKKDVVPQAIVGCNITVVHRHHGYRLPLREASKNEVG